MIRMHNVTKIYSLGKENSVTAVSALDLEIQRDEFIVITGRSGSGKTTLLNMAAGLTRPTTGEVLFDGVDLNKIPDKQQAALRAERIGFIFQFPSLLPSLTVVENVLLPGLFVGKGERSRLFDRAEELLEAVGLAEKRNVYPRQLSAGQQQRVVIARSLINRPDVLFADEPTSNLDERTELEIVSLLREMYQQQKVTVILVTHTSQLVGYGSRFIEMAQGAIIHSGLTSYRFPGNLIDVVERAGGA